MKIKANLLNKPVNFQLYRTKENGLLVSQYKTKSSTRTVSLPPPLLNILKESKESVNSQWMFPSPVREDLPLAPAYIRTPLCLILEHTQCKQIRFHDLRYIFATLAPQNGVDMKNGVRDAGAPLCRVHPEHSKFPYGPEPRSDLKAKNKAHKKVAESKNNPLESGDSSGFLVAGGGLEPPTSGL